jgi:hypothetical protein
MENTFQRPRPTELVQSTGNEGLEVDSQVITPPDVSANLIQAAGLGVGALGNDLPLVGGDSSSTDVVQGGGTTSSINEKDISRAVDGIVLTPRDVVKAIYRVLPYGITGNPVGQNSDWVIDKAYDFLETDTGKKIQDVAEVGGGLIAISEDLTNPAAWGVMVDGLNKLWRRGYVTAPDEDPPPSPDPLEPEQDTPEQDTPSGPSEPNFFTPARVARIAPTGYQSLDSSLDKSLRVNEFERTALRGVLELVYRVLSAASRGTDDMRGAVMKAMWMIGSIIHCTREPSMDKCLQGLERHFFVDSGYDQYLATMRNRLMHSLHGNRYSDWFVYQPLLLSRKDRNRLAHALNGNTEAHEDMMSVPDDIPSSSTANGSQDGGPTLRGVGSEDKSAAPVAVATLLDHADDFLRFTSTNTEFSINAIRDWGEFINSNPTMVSYDGTSYNIVANLPSHGFMAELKSATTPFQNTYFNYSNIQPVSAGYPGRATPAVRPVNLYSEAMTAVASGPGGVASQLRQRLTTSNGDINYLHARQNGDNVLHSVGTSSAEVPTRILNYLMALCPFSLGPSSMLEGEAFSVTYGNSVVTAAGMYPWSEKGTLPPPAPIAPEDITMGICSLSTFVEIGTGVQTVHPTIDAAGFGPAEWGESCAVVPIRISESGDGYTNLIWALAHMEAPYAMIAQNGVMKQVSLSTLTYTGVPWLTMNNFVRVPGPKHHVLFVVVDIQQAFSTTRNPSIAFGSQLVALGSTHDIGAGSGFTALEIGQDMYTTFSDFTSLPRRFDMCLRRWINNAGNEEDWHTALLNIADVSCVSRPPLMRQGAVIEGLVKTEYSVLMYPTGAATVVTPDTAGLLSYPFGTIWSSASGNKSGRYSWYIQPVDTDHKLATHRIPRIDPMMYIGAWAGFFTFMNKKEIRYNGPVNLCGSIIYMNATMTAVTDRIMNATGLGLVNFMEAATNNEKYQVNGLRETLRGLYSRRFFVGSFYPTYVGNLSGITNGLGDVYPNITPLSLMPARRISPLFEAQFGVGLANLPEDNVYGFPDKPFRVVRTAGGNVDQLVYDALDLLGYDDADAWMRSALAVGAFSVGSESTVGFKMVTKAGDASYDVVIPIDSPYITQYRNITYRTYYSITWRRGTIEYIGPPPIVKARVDEDFTEYYLSTSGLRQIMKGGGKSAPLRNFVVQTNLATLTNDEFVSSETPDVVRWGSRAFLA